MKIYSVELLRINRKVLNLIQQKFEDRWTAQSGGDRTRYSSQISKSKHDLYSGFKSCHRLRAGHSDTCRLGFERRTDENSIKTTTEGRQIRDKQTPMQRQRWPPRQLNQQKDNRHVREDKVPAHHRIRGLNQYSSNTSSSTSENVDIDGQDCTVNCFEQDALMQPSHYTRLTWTPGEERWSMDLSSDNSRKTTMDESGEDQERDMNQRDRDWWIG